MSLSDTLTSMPLDELAALMAAVNAASEEAGAEGDQPALPAVEGAFPPLSYAQERLVFMDRLSEGNAFYNLAYGHDITGPLHVEAWRGAWLNVVSRHEPLRSVFPDDEQGKPCVRFIEPERCAVQYHDVRALTEEERQALIDQAKTAMFETPFFLKNGPLTRAVLYRKSDSEFTFLYGFHHSVFDGWSMTVFLDELIASYNAYVNGQSPTLSDMPATHGQYALWQRKKMEGPYGREEGRWWQEYLSDVDDLHLKTDKPRPQAQSFAGDRVAFAIARPVRAALEKTAEEEGASHFMLWLSLFSLVLGRYSGQTRFTVGSSITGRPHPDTESMIGFLVNNLVIKCANASDLTFRRHLASIKESVLTSYSHGELPFQMVTQSLGRHPDVSRNPVYQAAFTYQNLPETGLGVPGLHFSDVTFPTTHTHVDVDLLAWPSEGELTCCLVYATDLFERNTAEAFCGSMREAARSLAERPERSIRDLFNDRTVFPSLYAKKLSVITGPEESYRFLSPWERLMEHAARKPDAAALILSDDMVEIMPGPGEPRATGKTVEVSFARLASMSASVASSLNDPRVGPGQRTAILLYTGVEMFAATLGVWHRNGAWLLVDPETPPSRLQAILDEFKPDSMVSTPEIMRACGQEERMAGIFFYPMPAWRDLPARADASPPVKPVQDDFAGFLFTSGSTGRPKGAPFLHGDISRRLSWEMENYPLKEGDLACLKNSVSYADFFGEVFVPLLSGVPLLLLGHSPARDVQRLLQKIEMYGVTKLVIVPSLLKTMHRITDGLKGRLGSVRYIRTSGELLPARLAEETLAAIPGLTLYSVYGSMEMLNPTGYCCPGQGFEAPPGQINMPAGHPLPGRQVAVLDEYRLPVPRGAAGEIYASGWGLVPGYIGNERASTFCRLNLTGTVERWYQSGDTGYIDASGQLIVTGRKDFQIKIRGVRVEPDDVEEIMLRHPGVREAKVTAWEDADGNKRLFGFVLLGVDVSLHKNDRPAFARKVRMFLLERLPAVMVPDCVTILEEWPRTPTGKTSTPLLRDAFKRETANADPHAEDKFQGPAEVIAGIWGRIIGGYSQDAKTTFFEAGGNSLSLVTLHSELQRAFQREFPLTVLFQNPTIESQVHYLSNDAGRIQEKTSSGLPRRGRQGLLGRRPAVAT